MWKKPTRYWLSWDVTAYTASNGKSTKEVMLRKFQVSYSSSASNFSCSKQERLSLAANTSAQFWSNVFETFFPKFFLCVAFFVLANGLKLLCFFNDIFKLKSTIYKRRTPRPARQLYQTQMFSNCSYAIICHATLNASLLLMTTCWRLSIGDN